MVSKNNLVKINDWLWEIPRSFRNDMRVPGRIYASEKILGEVEEEAINQVVNVATLPGIVRYSLAMPDIHSGYGFAIGGVAATEFPVGMISPGGIGYDQNCLPPKTRVLLGNGTHTTIGELEKNWQNQTVGFVDFSGKKLESAQMIYFLKKYNNPIIYRIMTQSGEVIEATKDHPIQTKGGMKEVQFLTESDFVLIYPFKGVEYKQPSSKAILDEVNYRKTLMALGKTNKGSAISQVLKEIHERNLLPLTYKSSHLSTLLKLMGFIFGDGVITFSRGGKNAQIHFYGKPEDLSEIQKDIRKIGFSPPKIYSRTRDHSITTFYRNYKFSTTEHSLKIGSTTLAALLVALGTPYGTKSHQEYRIPKWIFGCPLWQKRLFLASFFGAELSKPATLNKYNFYAPQFSVQKKEGIEENARELIGDAKKLIREFGVQASEIREVPGYRYEGKQGKTRGFRLQIKENAKNLVRFFEIIGYEYNLGKQREACLAANYLRRKLRIVEIRNKARKEIQKLYRQRGDFKKLVGKYFDKYTPYQFLYHSLFEENSWGIKRKRGNPRIAFSFPSFEEYKRANSYGKEGLVWDKIEKIEKIPYADFVYDFTVNNENHNFIANNFVVSNCGVRLLKSEYTEAEIRPYLEKLATEIQKEVPSGLGRGRQVKLSNKEMEGVLEGGAKYLIVKGYGGKEDLENCEAEGFLKEADAKLVSNQAKNRGKDQLGTLGSGNHFCQFDKVEEIFDEKAAEAFGLFKGQVVVFIHTGSRGLGHQNCTDYLRIMVQAMQRYGIRLPDRELAGVPFNSSEGQKFFQAMCAGANFAWANRQMITYYVRKAWQSVLGKGSLKLLYDVAHNIAKIEEHEVDGKKVKLIVHRKGATRAFPAGHPELPKQYQEIGQPVLVPGSMGSASYVLAGTEKSKEAWHTVCHGAGRIMSRHEAIRTITGEQVVRELNSKGIIIKCQSFRGIAEEASLAYKNIDEIVEVVHQAGLSKKVARLVPLAVIKGE